MQRIRIKYKKDLPFIGHLDMVRLWERALRRTDLACAYSEGFNPRQKMSFGPPLPLGFTSECEFLDIYFERWMNPEAVKDALNKTLPRGIEIIEAKNVFSARASLTAEIKTAVYSTVTSQDLSGKIYEILDSKEIIVKRKEKDINIRPMIKDLRQTGNNIFIAVQCDNFGTLKGSEIRGLFNISALGPTRRVELY